MARTPSTMLSLGTSAPAFTLPDPASGEEVSLSDYAGKPLLVMFICNHCPFVIHILDELVAFSRHYQSLGLSVVAINANDVASHPADGPEHMAQLTADKHFPFVYLYDASQEVAKAYEAACTPDFFIFDSNHRLAYRGQFDGARPGNDVPVSGKDMRAAVDAILVGESPEAEQKASLGCNIKWIKGHEPDYH